MRSSYCAGLPNADLSTCLQAALRYLGEYLSANAARHVLSRRIPRRFLGDRRRLRRVPRWIIRQLVAPRRINRRIGAGLHSGARLTARVISPRSPPRYCRDSHRAQRRCALCCPLPSDLAHGHTLYGRYGFGHYLVCRIAEIRSRYTLYGRYGFGHFLECFDSSLGYTNECSKARGQPA